MLGAHLGTKEVINMNVTYADYQCVDCGHITERIDIGAGTIDPCPQCLSVLGSYRVDESYQINGLDHKSERGHTHE